MPPIGFLTKALKPMSKAQWIKTYQRILKGRTGVDKLTKGQVNASFKRQPYSTGDYGKTTRFPKEQSILDFEKNPGAPAPKPETSFMPIGEAQEQFMNNPKQVFPHPAGPDVRSLRTVPSGASNEIPGTRIANEDMRFKNIIDPSAKKVLDQETSMMKAINQPEQTEMVKDVMFARVMWKDVMGGLKTRPGKLWKRVWEQSPNSHSYKTAEDFFISNFTRWRKDPEVFLKKHPREGGLLNLLLDPEDIGKFEGIGTGVSQEFQIPGAKGPLTMRQVSAYLRSRVPGSRR